MKEPSVFVPVGGTRFKWSPGALTFSSITLEHQKGKKKKKAKEEGEEKEGKKEDPSLQEKKITQ